jgi:hypothetical protein
VCNAPAGLLDILQGPHLCTSLQLNAVICLVSRLLLLLLLLFTQQSFKIQRYQQCLCAMRLT